MLLHILNLNFLINDECVFAQILLEQISSLEEREAANRRAAEELPVLKNDLDVANRSLEQLNNSLDAFRKDLYSANETKTHLESSLTEKVKLISALETEILDLTEKMRGESESHRAEIQNLLNKEKQLKEQLEASQKSVAAAKTELGSRREEIRTMKSTIAAASRGLEERDGTIKSLKEKLNQSEAEQVKASDLLKEKIAAMNKIKVGYQFLGSS